MKTITDPMSVNFANLTLTCRLLRHVITSEGDFVPAGTPVKVMGWKGNGITDPEMTDDERREMVQRPKIEVRTSAYMYADTFDHDAGTSAVGCGLYLSVDPADLTFDSITEK